MKLVTTTTIWKLTKNKGKKITIQSTCFNVLLYENRNTLKKRQSALDQYQTTCSNRFMPIGSQRLCNEITYVNNLQL